MTHVGFGGSNAAIILEQAPLPWDELDNGLEEIRENKSDCVTRGERGMNFGHELTIETQNGDAADNCPLKRLYVFSAKSEVSLSAYISSFKDYLESTAKSSTFMKNLGFTLGVRRTHHPYRIAVVADSIVGLKSQLAASKPKRTREETIAFIFTGQGAQ